MNKYLGWSFGVISLLMTLVYWLLPSQWLWLDALAGLGYLAAAVLLIPPTRALFLERVLQTTWSNDLLLRWIFVCVLLGAGCAFFTRQV